MTDGDRSRMDWDTSRPSSQTYGGESYTVLAKVLIGIAVTIVALPVLGIGLLFLLCLIPA